MFRTYFHNEEAYGEKFKDRYYITGYLAYQDTDGYFSSRAAGFRIAGG